jgi:hypothetical protein
LLKFCITILFCRQYFSPFHIYEKREGSGSVTLTNRYGSRSGRLKNMRNRIRIPNTAFLK